MKDEHARGVAEDVAGNVAEDLAFGGAGDARPPRQPTTVAAASFAQLATR